MHGTIKYMNPKLKALKNAIGKGVKKVGNFLDKQFIEPSRRVNRYNAKMDALNRANAKAGKFNTGEASAESTY